MFAGAGGTLTNQPDLAGGVGSSILAGMIPDIEVDPRRGPSGCSGDPNGSTRCLPRTAAGAEAYARGFAATASSIRRAYPGRRILFEPMNEPWDWASPAGTQSGKLAASEYAAVLARVLPAARAAGIR